MAARQAAYDMFTEAGWQSLSFPEQYGGQGLPTSMALIQAEMMAAANFTFLMFPGLSKVCARWPRSHLSVGLPSGCRLLSLEQHPRGAHPHPGTRLLCSSKHLPRC